MIKIQTAVIGGGVVGAAILRELATEESGSVFLFEKAMRLGEGQTGRSSGVLHSGILYPPGSLKARLCAESNELIYQFCAQQGIAAARTGKLIVATREKELEELHTLLENAPANSVHGVELLSSAEVRAREPNVEAIAALSVPSAGIVDAAALTFALAGQAEATGAHVLTGFEIISVTAGPDGFEIHGKHHGADERFLAERVINSAGLRALAIGKTLNPDIKGRARALRGEYYRFNRLRREKIHVSGTLVYPLHELVTAHDGQRRVGCIASVHLTPTFGMGADHTLAVGSIVRIGPIFYPTDDLDDISPPRLPAELFARQCGKYLHGILGDDLEPDSAGVMAAFDSDGTMQRDFVIQRDATHRNAIHLLGIGSPGLTCSLSIGRYVKELVGAN